MRTWRIRGLAAALALLVASSVLVLVVWAMVGAERAERARHLEVGQRVVDAIESELSDLIAREEQRSFLEYRAYYLPEENNQLGNVVRSPLTKTPTDPTIRGYFQRDPDGTVHSPTLPRDNELKLALDEGWTPAPAASRTLQTLSEAVSGLSVSPYGGDTVAPRAPEGSLSKLNSLGSRKRSGRVEEQVATNAQALNVYNNDAPVQQTYAPTAEAPDVRISPFAGQRDGDTLILYRAVRIGSATTLQGLVLDLPVLEASLRTKVLEATGLQDHVHLTWDGSTPAGRWRYDQRLASPFASIPLAVGLDPIPGVTSLEGPLLRGLTGGMFVLLAIVGGALIWAVRTELNVAQQRSDFVAAVSHELKTPLTSIRMYAEMLRDGMVPDPDRQRLYHSTITSESERLTRLIGNVLELSRLEQGGPGSALVAGDLGEVVAEAVEMLRPHAAAHQVTLELVQSPTPPVKLDRDALIQVLMNLVDNAIKFGGAGVVTLTVGPSERGAMLGIRDHGPGVPRGQLERIFEPFYRGERELTRTTKGTGIGLALVRGLLADMGGMARARNHPDGGLEVMLELRPA